MPHILADMDRLWTPWRYSYITGAETKGRRKGVPPKLDGWPAEEDRHCVFCNMVAAVDYAVGKGMEVAEAERAVYLVERGATCFVCLNAYPYGTGHVMIVPYLHTDSLAALPGEVAREMMQTVQRVERCLREVYRPDGMNFGLNLGEAAGAGIAEHLHLHGVPRWNGDVNFMTVLGETRILPEILDVSWAKLREGMKQSLAP
jgi:ATP adenylyltransferase